MPEVIVRKGEPIDRALKRLKSKLDAEGIMDEVRRLRAFETPTQKSEAQGEGQRQTRESEVPLQSAIISARPEFRRAIFNSQPARAGCFVWPSASRERV